MSKFKDVRTLTISAMLVAVSILLGFFKIPISELIEIRFLSLPLAVAGALFGPAVGCVVGVLGDLGGFLVKPTGAYFPGFTISSGISGLLFGWMFYKKDLTVKQILLAQILNTVVVNLVINSINLSILYGNAFFAVLSLRLAKEVVMIPINTILLLFVMKPLSKTAMIRHHFVTNE